MDKTLSILDLIAGIGLTVSGLGFLFAWFKERRYPDRKKLGSCFTCVGNLLLISYFFFVEIFYATTTQTYP